ncbi:tetraspanin-15 [Nicotiana sylvestris]|uniref:Tetraspanin-15-like n=1 Tax=Nicotiana sylvestris TaxID=4096 RepID=A0A1U7XRD3_NICSY|nr:PREDICTED: tetraspanin-15-like [Nicotiana sylvestris]
MAENPNNLAEAVVAAVPEVKNEVKLEFDEPNMKEAKSKLQMNHIVLPLVIFSFFLSLPILFGIIWLFYVRQYDCEELMNLPKLQIGIAIGLIIVFFISNIVVYFRSRFPVLGLLLAMVPFIIMFIVGLGLVGSYKMEARGVPGSPAWLKMTVHDDETWSNIKSCIYSTKTCNDLISRTYMLKSYDFTSIKLSSVESGCCSPPSLCEMEFINATFWRKVNSPIDDSATFDKDCNLWQNEETVLCYNCHACKEGYLRTIEGKWSRLGAFLVTMSLLLMISHLFLFMATMWEKYVG